MAESGWWGSWLAPSPAAKVWGSAVSAPQQDLGRGKILILEYFGFSEIMSELDLEIDQVIDKR